MKTLAIAISDMHYHEWPDFGQKNSRLSLYSAVWDKLLGLCIKYNCKTLLHGGDLIHNPISITNVVLDQLTMDLTSLRELGIELISISGNHDQTNLSTKDSPSINYIRSLSRAYPNIRYIDRTFTEVNSIRVYGIPYVNDPKSFLALLPKKKRGSILMMHQTLPGSAEGNGFKLESAFSDSIYKELKPFGLVLNGHVHKRHVHAPNIITMGSTHQQRTSDKDVEMGAMLIMEDLSWRWVNLKMPEFVYGVSDGWNLGIPKPKEDEVEEEQTIERKEFHADNSRELLIDNYLKKKKVESPKTKRLLIKYLQ